MNRRTLKCPHDTCGHIWKYSGKSNEYTSCPICGWRVHVKRNRFKKEEIKNV